MLDEEEAISPGGTRRKQRPQHLILSRQHSGGSNASTSSSGSFEAIERDRPSGESSDGKQTDIHAKLVHNHKLLDIKSQTRTGAEGAEVIHVGTIKKKPSALGRAGISDHKDDRSLSPSRRSPKSPPRSPSWKRYRESPPRSPTMYSISPSMSPTERFPSTLVERTSPSLSREETYGEEYARDQETFSFDQQDMNNYSLNDPRGHFDRPPPKPARMSGPYQFEDEFSAPHTLDLAAYAATVASDTAHLTNMSVSPTCKLDVPDAADHHEFLEVSPEQESISPPSPNYFEDVDEEVDVNEPTPKSIDYQNTKRQRVKPPATDWSPVTDLSPIIDVSPSIERLEQEKMLEEQMYSEDSDLLFDSPPCTIKRRPKPQAANKPEASEGNQIQPAVQTDGALSPLKRYQAFHDISSICTPATNTNANNVMASSDQMPRNEEQTQVKILDANTPDLIHSVRAVNDKSKMANIDASNVSQPPQSMKDRDILRDTTSRPDLCTRQDSSSRDSIKLVQKHPSITRDMIINNNNIVTEAVDRRVIQKDDNDRRLPGSKSEENVTRARPALNNENKNNKYGSQKDKPTHPSLGDLERSSSGESSKSKDSTSSSSKVKLKPLCFSSLALVPAESSTCSHLYGVLKSPISPANKAFRDLDYLDRSSDCSPSEAEAAERAYMYPSPVTPPDPDLSPPIPQSPSVFTDELLGDTWQMITPRVTRATQASFRFDGNSCPSTLGRGSGCVCNTNQMSSSGSGVQVFKANITASVNNLHPISAILCSGHERTSTTPLPCEIAFPTLTFCDFIDTPSNLVARALTSAVINGHVIVLSSFLCSSFLLFQTPLFSALPCLVPIGSFFFFIYLIIS